MSGGGGVLNVLNSINNLENFFADIISASNTYYYFVGDTIPWDLDSDPPPANSSIEFQEQIYHDIVFGKLLTNNNLAFITNNYIWVSNTVYSQYDKNDANLFSKNFYVTTTPDYSVYKCIDNNNESPSTISPSLRSTIGSFQTSDGYTWKYMFTIPVSTNTIFSTANFIPVVANSFVANNATPGTIDITRVSVGGINYQAYNEDVLNYVLNQNAVKLGPSANSTTGYYVGSSIYLKAGLGANQLRQIIAYDGPSQTATVNTAFQTYMNLSLAPNYSGSFNIGDTILQNLIQASIIYNTGFFNSGDFVIQSDTTANAYVGFANTTYQTFYSPQATLFLSNYPIIDTAGSPIAQTGTVTIVSGSNTITANTANLLNLSVNNFIQVGTNNYTNIRRITSITNSSIAYVSLNFNANLNSNVFYTVPDVCEPTGVSISGSNGVVTQVNLTSARMTYNNTSPNNISYILGEIVEEYNTMGQSLAANGVVSFVNSSTIILSFVQGSFAPGDILIGQSSNLSGQILQVQSYPNITIDGVSGSFVTGIPFYDYTGLALSGQANLLSFSVTPSGATEYLISPTVLFSGDGNGATAYAIVNTATGSAFEITDIPMINIGAYYTYANVTITANSSWGNGAVGYPVLSPDAGHGANAISELGATIGGISVTFDTIVNETFKFPNYGSYRKVGIIKNPLFNTLWVETAPPLNQNFTISNITGSFSNNEIIFQPSTNSAATVISGNSSFIQIGNVSSSTAFANTGNNFIIGLISGATANLISIIDVFFDEYTNTQIIYEQNTNANGLLIQVVNSTLMELTNVCGKFTSNVIVYDPTINAYSLAVGLYTQNSYVNVTSTFGTKFNQTMRVPLSGSSINTIPYIVGERLVQDATNATGLLIDDTHELDFIYSSISGTFSIGVNITDANSGATGVILYANSNYMRITAANGIFSSGDVLSSSGANGSLDVIYPVLVISDIGSLFEIGNNSIIGQTSGAIGVCAIANTITWPDLVRETGSVIYINDIQPFTLSPNTKETFLTYLQF